MKFLFFWNPALIPLEKTPLATPIGLIEAMEEKENEDNETDEDAALLAEL